MPDSRPPRHVTISGDLGSGKSSVAAELSEMLGYPVVSTGSLQREIASSLQMTTLEANLHAESDWSIDDRIDGMTVRVAREATGGIVFDSRMAWHFVPGALKVWLTVDPYVAAQRVVGRGVAAAEHYGSVDEAFGAILDRSASEGRRFKAIYGVDVAQLANFDLVMDTSALGVGEAAVLIARAHARPPAPRRVLVCPRTVIPAFGHAADAGPRLRADARPSGSAGVGTRDQVEDRDAVAVGELDTAARIVAVHVRPFFFAVDGQVALAEAIAAGDAVVPVHVIAEGEEELPWGGSASSMVWTAGTDGAVRRWEDEHGVDLAGLRHYLGRRSGVPPQETQTGSGSPQR
ncbi:MAG: cytidylate kinase family protein [Bifidobacteriaceae bacterium]|jgi:predicted cytidylate kinase|nr:cytidylate kinase family protein [Bifidobacteriaceae bacterium]